MTVSHRAPGCFFPLLDRRTVAASFPPVRAEGERERENKIDGWTAWKERGKMFKKGDSFYFSFLFFQAQPPVSTPWWKTIRWARIPLSRSVDYK